MKHFGNKVKSLGVKPLLSAGIFLSLVLLGNAEIFAATPRAENLNKLLSTKNANKLSATMWDTLLGEVGNIGNDLDTLSGNTATQITALSGRVTQLSGTVNNIISSQRTTNGNNIYYTKGNVGIGTTNPTVKLQVAGNIIASYPTAANHVATKQYVDDKISANASSTYTISVPSVRGKGSCDGYPTCPSGYSEAATDRDAAGCFPHDYRKKVCIKWNSKTVNVGTTCGDDWKVNADKLTFIYTEHRVQADGSCKGGSDTTYTIGLSTTATQPELGLY